MLDIRELSVKVDNKQVLDKVSLTINPGEVHAIMGPNGSGKSTLASVLAGKSGYEITSGSIEYQGQDLLAMSTSERALHGIFLALQYPVAIPGVTNINFLKAILNAKLKFQGKAEVNSASFLKLVREYAAKINMREDLLYRGINSGFSGGEKKRNEILQMMVLEPRLAIFDETDSGLDIDALKEVATAINNFKNKERGFLMITHYQRLLDYVVPDKVHVLAYGKMIKSGGSELAHELEQKGYGWLDER